MMKAYNPTIMSGVEQSRFRGGVRNTFYGSGCVGLVLLLCGELSELATDTNLSNYNRAINTSQMEPNLEPTPFQVYSLKHIKEEERDRDRAENLMLAGALLALPAAAIESKKLIQNIETKILGY